MLDDDLSWLVPVEELPSLPLDPDGLTVEQKMSLAWHIWEAPEEYIRRFFYIQGQDREFSSGPSSLMRLEPNRTQLELIKAFKKAVAEDRPVRIMVLKARQEGVSTITEALGAALAMNNPDFSMWVIAQDRSSSENLFAMTERYIDNLDPAIKPMIANRDRKRIRFNNPDKEARYAYPGLDSRIYVDQAKNVTAGRSATIHFLHISERAFWGRDGRKTLTSLLQAVPATPRTVVVQETTANGVDDPAGFYEDWWKHYGRDGSEWTCLFFPWFIDERYRMPVPDHLKGQDGRLVLRPDPDGTMREDRLRAGMEYVSVDGTVEIVPIDDEQLYWRRWAINERCHGDVFVFMQEFPATPHEAFRQSGNPWWDRAGMERISQQIVPPKAKGVLQVRSLGSGRVRPDRFDKARVASGSAQIELVPDEAGPWWIFEEPRPGRTYLVGIDVAEGGSGGDASAIEVFDADGLVQVAEFSGQMDVDTLAHQAAMACWLYNKAFAIPEVNGPGMAFMQEFTKLWNRLYYRIDYDSIEEISGQVRFGFRTTSVTRPVITMRGQAYVREGLVTVRSSRLFAEMQSFVRDARGVPRAAGKGHDDLVMAFLFVLELAEQRPVQSQKPPRGVTLEDDAYFAARRGRRASRKKARFF